MVAFVIFHSLYTIFASKKVEIMHLITFSLVIKYAAKNLSSKKLLKNGYKLLQHEKSYFNLLSANVSNRKHDCFFFQRGNPQFIQYFLLFVNEKFNIYSSIAKKKCQPYLTICVQYNSFHNQN